MNTGGTAVLVISLLVVAGCKSKRPLAVLNRDIPARSPEKLLERLVASDTLSVHFYSAKANVQLSLPAGNKSFKAQVRSVRDSAAWISVIPALGIEMARVLLTTDSLKMLDKLHDTFFVGDTLEAERKFGLQPDLSLLQDALLGRPIGLQPDEKYRSDRENGQYVLTSKEKRKFVRAAEDISPGDTLASDRDMKERRLERTLRKAEERQAIVLRYWIEPDAFKITRVQITDLMNDRTADVRYEEWGGAEEHFLPTRISITLSEPNRQATGTMELSRINLEGPLQLSFKVPEKYTPMP